MKAADSAVSGQATSILSDVAKYIHSDLRFTRATGFTLDICVCTWTTPSFTQDSYLVSLAGCGQSYHGFPSSAEVFQWLWLNRHKLCLREHYVGGWLDDETGEFWLDVTVAQPGLHAALWFGILNQQKAVFHPDSGQALLVADILNSLN